MPNDLMKDIMSELFHSQKIQQVNDKKYKKNS